MRLLLHTCCAPCIIAPLAELRREGFDATAYFYNPNIHPLLEFRKRLKAVEVFAAHARLPLAADNAYGLQPFLEAVWPDVEHRCAQCYRMRLMQTARAAAEGGFDGFSSSLLFSPRQQYERIVELGREAAETCGVEFIVRDLRHLYPDSQEESRRLSLYRQQYCGCIFSEYDRYKDTSRELHRGT